MNLIHKLENKFGYKLNEAYTEAVIPVNMQLTEDFKQKDEVVVISPQQAFDLMWNTGGQIFTVVFIKKDGTERVMTARRNVTQHLKGGELGYKPSELQLIPCYEMIGNQQGGYKMVNAKTTKLINYQGKTFSVDQNL